MVFFITVLAKWIWVIRNSISSKCLHLFENYGTNEILFSADLLITTVVPSYKDTKLRVLNKKIVTFTKQISILRYIRYTRLPLTLNYLAYGGSQ